MNNLKVLFSVFLFITGFVSSATAFGETITFIHMNDLHAHLTPHKDLVAVTQKGITTTEVVDRGGLVRIAKLINKIRDNNPKSVLMNIGDTYHGGAEALYSSGNDIIAPVDALGIDVGVPGNWDFAYGPHVTVQRYAKEKGFINDILKSVLTIKAPAYPMLAANVSYIHYPNLIIMDATKIIQVGNVKVGFIGLTSDIVKKMHKSLATGLKFTQGEVAYKAKIIDHATKLAADGANIIVVMSELGIQKDYQLANNLPVGLVDVIFSAHTHETTFKPLESVSGALVVEAGNDGYLGRMDIEVKNGIVVDRKWKLLPVDASLDKIVDPRTDIIKELVETARKRVVEGPFPIYDPNLLSQQALGRPISTPVGYTLKPLDRRHALENSFNNMYSDFIRKMFPADVAMTPGFRFDSVIEGNPVAAGVITLEDVYRFFPVSTTIARGNVRGKRLKVIMEDVLTEVYSTDAFKQNGGWFEGWSGLSATVDLAQPDGHRITSLYLSHGNYQQIQDDTLLSVLGCGRNVLDMLSNILCGHGGFTNVVNLSRPNNWLRPWTNIDIFVYGLDSLDGTVDGQLLAALSPYTRKSIYDLNQTPAWPDTPFIQPLTGVPIAVQ